MITPNNESVNKKTPEIGRLIEFLNVSGLKPVDISEKTGVRLRTIQNNIWQNRPIGGRLLRELHSKYGVSVDWLLSGTGSMFINEASEQPTIYTVINKRCDRLCRFIKEYMKKASEEDQVWFEQHLTRTVHEYAEFLADEKNGALNQ